MKIQTFWFLENLFYFDFCFQLWNFQRKLFSKKKIIFKKLSFQKNVFSIFYFLDHYGDLQDKQKCFKDKISKTIFIFVTFWDLHNLFKNWNQKSKFNNFLKIQTFWFLHNFKNFLNFDFHFKFWDFKDFLSIFVKYRDTIDTQFYNSNPSRIVVVSTFNDFDDSGSQSKKLGSLSKEFNYKLTLKPITDSSSSTKMQITVQNDAGKERIKIL